MKHDNLSVDDEVFVFPVSFAQQRLWFLDQLRPGDPAYNLPFSVRLKGPLNVSAFNSAIEEIVRRHEVLRTTFTMLKGEPVQVVSPSATLPVNRIELTELSEDARERAAQYLAGEEARRSFNLKRGPLTRISVARLDQHEHIILLIMHHIISDAWSKGVLIDEITVLYEAFSAGRPSPLSELEIQYADYSVWQRDQAQSGLFDRQLAYWKKQLAGIRSVICLEPDSTGTFGSHEGATRVFSIGEGVMAGARKVSRRQDASLFMTLLAGFDMLISCLSGRDEVIVGANIANRNRLETEKLIGFFVNMLVLRIGLQGDPSFIEVVERVRQVTLSAYANQDQPYEKLVEEIGPASGFGRRDLFQVVFTIQNTPLRQLAAPGLELSPVVTHDETTTHDLVLNMREAGTAMVGTVTYNRTMFREPSINRLLGGYELALSALTDAPEMRLSQLKQFIIEAEADAAVTDQNRFDRARSRLRSKGRQPVTVSAPFIG